MNKSIWLVLLVLLIGSFPHHKALSVAPPGLEALEEDAWTVVAAPQQRAAPTATFVVAYTGAWPNDARGAFEHALSIWSNLIVSPVPIQVAAEWTALPSGALGSAGPFLVLSPLPEHRPQTLYPVALVNARTGSDVLPTQVDITARFSSAANWYFGIDGQPSSGRFDFVSVVLHEIGHGLGLVDSFDVNGDQGQWGLSGFPLIYDAFVENLARDDLLDTTRFPNPSTALGNQLQSNDVYFNGALAGGANNGPRPRLYAPTTWRAGSSIAHLNESTYPNGDENSLMTPAIGPAEVIHSPGPVGRAMLGDLGWQLAPLDLPFSIYLPMVHK